MPYAVDFNEVSTVGLESSPVAAALAGLRAHEARYFKNKYDHVFTVEPASNAKTTIEWVHRILRKNATSSSPLGRSRLRPFKSRTSESPTSSTRAVCRSTLCTPSTMSRSGRSGSSSPKAWKSPRSSPRGSNSRGKVEARRNHSRFLLRLRKRLLSGRRHHAGRRHREPTPRPPRQAVRQRRACSRRAGPARRTSPA